MTTSFNIYILYCVQINSQCSISLIVSLLFWKITVFKTGKKHGKLNLRPKNIIGLIISYFIKLQIKHTFFFF